MIPNEVAMKLGSLSAGVESFKKRSIALESAVKKGGPGSGRYPAGSHGNNSHGQDKVGGHTATNHVADKAGMHAYSKKGSTDSEFSGINPQTESEHTVAVKPDGSWKHTEFISATDSNNSTNKDRNLVLGKGKGEKSLSAHLAKYPKFE